MNDPLVTIDQIRSARQAFGDRIDNTPFLYSQTLSELTGADIWLKFENLQFTGSFVRRQII